MSTSTKRAFDHIVIIIFENEYRSYVNANPYMRSLGAQGTELAASFGVMHPSHPNYVASIAGQICNISADPLFYTFIPGAPPGNPPAPLQQPSLVDRIQAKGLGWKAYFEGYTPVEFPPQLNLVMTNADPPTVDTEASVAHTILDYMPYMNMHNPFARFEAVMKDASQWARLRPLYDFFTDVHTDSLPECSWIIPSLWGNGHFLWGTIDEPDERAPVLVDQQARWLESFFEALRFPGPDTRLPKRTLVVVTYDESDFEKDYVQAQNEGGTYDGPNQIYTMLLGDVVKPGSVEQEAVNHYSILRTIEKNFGLDDLGANDAEANWLQFLWGRSFRWGSPAQTPIASPAFFAAAGTDAALFVVYGTSDGKAHLRTFDGKKWQNEEAVTLPAGTTAIELAALGDDVVLVAQTNGTLVAMTRQNSAWSQSQTIVSSAPGAFALAAYRDYSASANKVMLVWRDSSDAVQSQIYSAGTWSAPVAVGQQTDGDITLAVLGASLFVIAKAVGSDAMNVVSYNTGPFNVVTGTSNGNSDTTTNAWSPTAYPMAHFGRGPRESAGLAELEPILRPYRGATPYVNATLDGVIHLASNAPEGQQVVGTTFSLSGLMTPLHPVSYASSTTNSSNGYGTLAQGGWSLQTPIAGVSNKSGGAMAMARFGSQLALLSEPAAGGALQLTLGGYA